MRGNGGFIAQNFIIVKNLKTCIALLYMLAIAWQKLVGA
jgi:hypothetical protein